MKKYLLILAVLFSSAFVFAQEAETSKAKVEPWFNVVFDEGVTYGQITRIEKMENRSNFVRETFLAGAFFNVETVDFWLVDFMLQINGYYPFYNAFNGMRQYPKQVLLYAVDGYFGAVYHFDYIKYLPIDLSMGLHYMYQLTDEYHMSYVGLGILQTLKFPLTERWTLVNNYFFSFDDANLGSNKNIQKFEGSYQYHIDIGIRYSGKVLNSYYYIKGNKTSEE